MLHELTVISGKSLVADDGKVSVELMGGKLSFCPCLLSTNRPRWKLQGCIEDSVRLKSRVVLKHSNSQHDSSIITYIVVFRMCGCTLNCTIGTMYAVRKYWHERRAEFIHPVASLVTLILLFSIDRGVIECEMKFTIHHPTAIEYQF